MISIDEVHGNRYRFPTIDFKFQNTGDATAFLWQFTVSVISAEIDLTPDIKFIASTHNGILEISATNQGWGDGSECLVKICEPILDQIFSSQTRQYLGTIKSGASQTLFSLSKALTIPEKFNGISQQFTMLETKESHGQKPLQGVRLDNPHLIWTCKDEKGKQHQGEDIPRFAFNEGYLALTSDGFLRINYLRIPAPAGSDVTYVSLIDPRKGAHERTYSISRKIPPGDIERFHIMIGSLLSCNLHLKFKFTIDKSKVIESEEFNLNIWNPRGQQIHPKYEDGSELQRKLQELQRKAKDNLINSWEKRELEDIERKAINFPFFDPPNHY